MATRRAVTQLLRRNGIGWCPDTRALLVEGASSRVVRRSLEPNSEKHNLKVFLVANLFIRWYPCSSGPHQPYRILLLLLLLLKCRMRLRKWILLDGDRRLSVLS